MHQAVLIVSIAAVFGAPLDDKRNVFARVAPNLAPTLLLDGAEAGISKLAVNAGKDTKYGKLYGPVAAYVARPTLSASSTLIAGAAARRAFRAGPESTTILRRSRDAGRRAVVGVGQGMAVVGSLVGARFKARNGTVVDAHEASDDVAGDGDRVEPAREPDATPGA
jgi:hypothetical protein